MLFEALGVLQPRPVLLLLDRGHICNTTVAAVAQREIPFCMRVDAHDWKCVTTTMNAPVVLSVCTYWERSSPFSARAFRGSSAAWKISRS